jgi:hypothetical protein
MGKTVRMSKHNTEVQSGTGLFLMSNYRPQDFFENDDGSELAFNF